MLDSLGLASGLPQTTMQLLTTATNEDCMFGLGMNGITITLGSSIVIACYVYLIIHYELHFLYTASDYNAIMYTSLYIRSAPDFTVVSIQSSLLN